jgi:hypothetical protein
LDRNVKAPFTNLDSQDTFILVNQSERARESWLRVACVNLRIEIGQRLVNSPQNLKFHLFGSPVVYVYRVDTHIHPLINNVP